MRLSTKYTVDSEALNEGSIVYKRTSTDVITFYVCDWLALKGERILRNVIGYSFLIDDDDDDMCIPFRPCGD